MLKNFISYNQKNIKLWQLELVDCKADLIKLNNEIEERQAQLANMNHQPPRRESSSLLRFRMHTEEKINHAREFQESIANLTKKIDCAVTFTSTFEEDPSTHAKTLADDLQVSISQYKKKLKLKNERVYVCFKNIDEKLHAIIHSPIDQADQNLVWRERYAILCGFMWDLYRLNNYLPFQDMFNDLVTKIDFAAYERVPGLEKTCGEAFDEFKKQHDQLFADKEIDLNAERIRLFNESLKTIRKQANAGDSLLDKQALHLAKTLEADVKTEQEKQIKAVKAEHYTDVLNKANQTLIDPIENGGQVIKCAKHVGGQSSTTEKVIGALIGFVGVTLLTASALAFAATCGASGPLCIVGGLLGATLIAKAGIIAAGLVGAYAAVKGVSMFAHGCSKAAYKEIVKFDAVENKMKAEREAQERVKCP